MIKEFKIFIINMLKLVGIMYISIGLKNILQIIIGTITDYNQVAKVYSLVNLKKRLSWDNKIGLIEILLIYDFVIFAIAFYLWGFLLLYILTVVLGNKLWLHIFYAIAIYLIIILFFDHFHPNFLFILITIFLGYANWVMFKKWIKFK